jgi:hypothetical protein
VSVPFGPDNVVPLLTGRDPRGAADLVARLGLAPPPGGRPVIVVCGGADGLRGSALDRARTVIEDAVAPVAGVTGAAVVDGGTATGVMRLTGAARALRPDAMPVLVGVAPGRLISYPGGPAEGAPLDSRHSHFILADSDRWGGETALLMSVAAALAGSGRVAMVLAGGGRVAELELAEARERDWPVLAIAGTGGVAGSLPGDADPGTFARRLSWELRDDPALKDAWRQFATYDQLAKRLRAAFTRLLALTLTLGVLATLLALLDDQVGGGPVLHWALVVVPVLVSVMIAVSSRRSFGQRWVVLRSAAESVKAEIYRYRALTMGNPDGAAQLAARLAVIETRLMRTEASRGALPPYQGPLPPADSVSVVSVAGGRDDGLSALDSERYLRLRVGDQAAYYHRRVKVLDRRRNALYLLAVLAGAAGAILAAAHRELWVTLTGGTSAAALAYLGYLQFDSTIVAYNQAAARLAALAREWRAAGPEQRTAVAFERLVAQCESALAAEQAGWVKHQNDAVAEANTPGEQ